MSQNYAYRTALDLQKAIATKQVSPVEIVRASLERIEALEPTINSFVTTTAESALDAAREAERAVMAGDDLGALHGLPISIKDTVPVGGVKFTVGSRTLAENVAGEDAPSVKRIRAAGACIVGKTTSSEFGAKAVGDSPLTGATRNPWNTTKTPGGSSAGAAASVAAGVTPLALGADGGGSIRIPCSLSGLVGFKAQFGRVPIAPVGAATTLAHVGPMTRTVRDAALLLATIAGYDRRDPFGLAAAVPDFLRACDLPVKGLRIAWSPTMGYATPSAEVRAIAGAAARTFEEFGCRVDLVEHVVDDPVHIWTMEFHTGLATRLKDLPSSSVELLDPEVRRIVQSGLKRSLEEYYSTIFERYALYDHMRTFFETYDLLLTPTLPVSAFDVFHDVPAEITGRDAVTWVYYTYPFNLTGQPAASIPAGFTANGLPVGLQLVSRIHREVDIFAAAAAFEEARPWADRLPPVA